MRAAVCFLVAVADRAVRERLVGVLGKYGTVVTATTLAEMKKLLDRKRTIQVLITARPMPDGDPMPVVRRFTRSKLAVDVPAAVIVPEVEACDASEIAEIERVDAYVLDPTMTGDRLLPILADRWSKDYAGWRRRLYEKPDRTVERTLSVWRSRYDLTDFQCALLHAAAGGAADADGVRRSHAAAKSSDQAVSDLLQRTGTTSYRDLIERFVLEVLGEPIMSSSPAPARRRARGAPRGRRASAATSRS